MTRHFAVILGIFSLMSGMKSVSADEVANSIRVALESAGENRAEIQSALDQVPDEHTESMRFLVANMPERDLTTLTAKQLLDNVTLAHQAWREVPWSSAVPQDIFLNNVLPYANINENRDEWRQDFYQRFKPLVRDARTPTEAATILNREIFKTLNVRYSTKRNRADQGPHESIKSGLASCTGLSILLIDACRAVGVPARFVGTPLWTNKSGNHSWVEIWDDGWHYTGAAEPTGDQLDRAWFTGRAATAERDHPLHAIYAVSFRRTPQTFPLVWDRSIDYVYAVNVTDRYTRNAQPIPAGHTEVQFRVIDPNTGDRVAAELDVLDSAGNSVFQGRTKDERFDANDHLTAVLPTAASYRLVVVHQGRTLRENLQPGNKSVPVTIKLTGNPSTVTP